MKSLSIWPFCIRLRLKRKRKKKRRLQQAKNLGRVPRASRDGVVIRRSLRRRVWFVIGVINQDTWQETVELT